MTQKDCIKFAAMISELKGLSAHHAHIDRETLDIVQIEMDKIFEADNPAYDSDRFFAACAIGAVPVLKTDDEYRTDAFNHIVKHTKFIPAQDGQNYSVSYQGKAFASDDTGTLCDLLAAHLKIVDSGQQASLL